MKNLIKLEEAAMFGFSIVLFTMTEFAWWWYLLLILTPDFSMLGYLAGNKIGAWVYNLFHHKATAILVLSMGWLLGYVWLEIAGIILLGHSSLDRIVGYGLKFEDDFKHTHIGWIGPKND